MSLLTKKPIPKWLIKSCVGSATAVVMVSIWMIIWDILGVFK